MIKFAFDSSRIEFWFDGTFLHLQTFYPPRANDKRKQWIKEIVVIRLKYLLPNSMWNCVTQWRPPPRLPRTGYRLTTLGSGNGENCILLELDSFGGTTRLVNTNKTAKRKSGFRFETRKQMVFRSGIKNKQYYLVKWMRESDGTHLNTTTPRQIVSIWWTGPLRRAHSPTRSQCRSFSFLLCKIRFLLRFCPHLDLILTDFKFYP